MANSRDETRPPDAALADQAAPRPLLRDPQRRGWSERLAPAGGLVLALLMGALVWLGAFTLWRLLS